MSKEKPKKKVLTPEEKEAKMQAARVYTDGLVEKALKAEQEYATFTQEQVDKIVAAAALAGSEVALTLAHEAVDETGRGVVEDKDTNGATILTWPLILSSEMTPTVFSFLIKL